MCIEILNEKHCFDALRVCDDTLKNKSWTLQECPRVRNCLHSSDHRVQATLAVVISKSKCDSLLSHSCSGKQTTTHDFGTVAPEV